MGPIIAFFNGRQGGTLKTTLAANLALEETLRGRRVLVVDFHHYPNLTTMLLPELRLDRAGRIGAERTFSSFRLFECPELGTDGLIRSVDVLAKFVDGFEGIRRTLVPNALYSAEVIPLVEEREWRPGEGILDVVPGADGLTYEEDLWEVVNHVGSGQARQHIARAGRCARAV